MIQKNAGLPPGEDTLAIERATSLSNACELMSNSLFVLPVLHADHLVGYVIRLQNVFIELAILYYHNETKRIKNNKDTLNRPNYQLLQARHLIKVSFFHEIRKDIPTALKVYHMTYTQLQDTKCKKPGEIKILCGFINFKICQLSFRTGAPLDAIAQFKRHIEHFKVYQGHRLLEFEHMTWLSQQFHIFGDLFNDAISAGLTAIQTQHPGFYYLQSAQYTMERRKITDKFRLDILALYEGGRSIVSYPEAKFFGQYPWDAESLEMENGEINHDEGIQDLQRKELHADYSRIIIPLLNSAVGQFKQYKPTRMKRFLMIQMGTEYYLAKDYEKAFSIAMCVLHEYRKERWWSLLTSVLDLCLKCSYLVCNVQDYICVCCELMSSNMIKSLEEREALQDNIVSIVAAKAPVMEQCNENAPGLWLNRLQNHQEYCIEMSSLASFLSCSVSFAEHSFQVDEKIVVKLKMHSTAVKAIQFTKIVIAFDDKKYICVNDDGAELLLQSQTQRELVFEMEPCVEDAGKVLRIVSVKYLIEGLNTIVLHYGDVHLPPFNMAQVAKVRHSGFKSAKITPKVAKASISLNYCSPFIVKELQLVTADICNKESVKINNIKLVVRVKDKGDKDAVWVSRAGETMSNFSDKLEYNLGALAPGDKTEAKLITQCNDVCDFDLSCYLTYCILPQNDKKPYQCEAFQETSLSSIAAFTATTTLISSRSEPIETLLTCDKTFIFTEVRVKTPNNIEIKEIRYSISDNFYYDEDQCVMQGIVMSKSNVLNQCVTVQPRAAANNVKIGSLSLCWRRKDCEQSFTQVVLELPSVHIHSLPVHLTNEIPSFGTLFSPLSVKLGLINQSAYVQEVDLVAEPGELFMFAGHKHLRCKLLPNSREFLCYRLVPLKSGLLTIPQPVVKLLRHPDIESSVITHKLTKNIYVRPKVFINS